MSDPNESTPIVLFDGVCNLCNGAVNFIINRDPKAVFRFASLQSDAGKDILARVGIHSGHERRVPANSDSWTTMILVEGRQYFTGSTAALRIASQLKPPWNWLHGLIIFPRPLRDAVYYWIARHRYRWFGRTNSCPLPTPEVKSRFLS